MSTLKKSVGLALAGLGILAFGMVSRSEAAISDTINVTVTVRVVSVSVSSATWAIPGPVTPSSVNISSAITVVNDGNVQEDYSLNLQEGSTWATSANGSAGADQFAMLALFTNTAVGSIADGDFAANDNIADGAPVAATADVFAITANADAVKGFNVTTGAPNRTLHLNFRAPTSNTVSAEQSITVTVTAAAG